MLYSIISVTCVSLNLPNGHINYSTSAVKGRYLVNTVASFSCNSGYYQNGSNFVTCQTSANWDEQSPICEGFIFCSYFSVGNIQQLG